jgi:EAL domain-containing protein (putative c-di-GMP-specific phosphodiesterase class I)/CheY-like chemotaxis protein
MDPITVLIADDQAELRAALVDLVSADDRLELIGQASDADEAISLVTRHRPDVALVDVRMPSGGGLRATRAIRIVSARTRVIALSAYEDRRTVLQMLGAGAVGYLVKGTDPSEIVRSILRAARGEGSVSVGLIAGVVEELGAQLRRDERAIADRDERSARIHRVIDGAGVGMVYQPIFDLETSAPVGAEALARFDVTDWPTERWFREAPQLGLATPLDLTLIRLALADLPRLRDGYLSVNASQATARSAELVEILAASHPERIVVELTEHEAIEDYDELGVALERLRELGVRIAIDDAGAGFASLRHILQLSPDLIKLDISITAGVDQDRARRAMSKALISFADEMGITIVAEGLETQPQIDTLRALGVRFGQGFLLARPRTLASP